MAQSPEESSSTTEVIRYDLGWKAINAMLRSGRSLSGHERNCCFLNTGGARFANISAAAGLDFIDDGRVVALVDWDYDGDIDFWIANRSGPQVRYLQNDLGRQHHFVVFALEGVQSSRDAIGARVRVTWRDVAGQLHQQIQTLRAGEGYLSQSSKWLHFGLGRASQLDRVVVRWPSGTEHILEKLDVDQWYRLREDRSQPESWSPPTTRFARFSPSDLVAPADDDEARILLLEPLPLPQLTYVDDAGSERTLTSPSQPLLVNLWATWCQPCLQELSRWSERAADLEQAGLHVVAVNIDEAQTTAAGIEQAGAVAASMQLPFEHGYGGEELVTKFDLLQRSLLSRERPLPVPCSFLIDSAGRLRALYKGPVSVDRLLQDAELVTADRAEILAAAVPFAGRWSQAPAGSSPLQLALRFLEGGYSGHAKQYIRALIDQRETHPEYLSASLLNLYGAIFVDEQQLQQAATAFAEALELEPDHRQAHIELGDVLLRLGNGGQARQHFVEVLKASPDDPELLYKLGLAHMQQRDYRDAAQSMRRSLQLRDHAAVHWQLGNTYVALSDARRAIDEYEYALKLKPELTASANNLAWLLATSDDDRLRNGARALNLAQQICDLKQQRTPRNLDTLAAALAENGQFAQAVQTAEEAIRLANDNGEERLAARIRERQSLFRQGQAFHEKLRP